jgi:hypothetical protein
MCDLGNDVVAMVYTLWKDAIVWVGGHERERDVEEKRREVEGHQLIVNIYEV